MGQRGDAHPGPEDVGQHHTPQNLKGMTIHFWNSPCLVFEPPTFDYRVEPDIRGNYVYVSEIGETPLWPLLSCCSHVGYAGCLDCSEN